MSAEEVTVLLMALFIVTILITVLRLLCLITIRAAQRFLFAALAL